MLSGPSGATRVAALIGDPVEHSLSPVLHNAAFRALGLDWIYVAFPVPAGRAADAVAAVRALRLVGLSVTMPHKAGVAAAVDRLDPVAARLGVANTVAWSGDELVGASTDGAGFVASIGADSGFEPAGTRCLVLGAGGAARSIVLALAEGGAAQVTVVARQVALAATCAELAGPGVGRASTPAELEDALGQAELVVNATPVGMGPGEGLPFGMDAGWLRGDHVVADLIYAPATTPLLAAARRAGAGATNGLGMLVHQAALQVQLWTGRAAPIAAMAESAARAVADRA